MCNFSDESRRKREEVSIEIRKSKREEQVQKRRQMTQGQGIDTATDNSSASAQSRVAEIQEKLRLLPNLVAAVNSDDPTRQIEAVTQFRKLLSIGNENKHIIQFCYICIQSLFG